jgi:hypothetical protein
MIEASFVRTYKLALKVSLVKGRLHTSAPGTRNCLHDTFGNIDAFL